MHGQKLTFIPTEPSSAPEKRRTRKTETSNMGCALRRCTSTNNAHAAAATPALATATVFCQPAAAPWMMKQVNPSTPMDKASMPGRSSTPACGLRDSPTPACASSKVSPASGTWMRNTQRQPSSAWMAPPISGPKPRPMPNTMPQIANARARAGSSTNRCERIAAWQINMAPPPSPCRPRASTSTAMSRARPQASEVAPNIARLAISMRLRP